MFIKNFIKNVSLKPKLLDGLKWFYIDLYRYIRDRKKRKIVRISEHGIHLLVGSTGGGKTTMAVYLIDKMIEKYGRDNLYIASNTFLEGQDFQITHWGDLTLFYNKPMIMLYDECNSDWTQNSYKELDIRLREALTQNRKGFSKMVLSLSQDYGMLLNEWRRLAKKTYVCKTLFGRYTFAKRYASEEYEELYNTTEINKKMKIHRDRRYSVVQTDEFRKKYDSFGRVKSIKKPFKDYRIRQELLPYLDLNLTDLNDYVIEPKRGVLIEKVN